MELASIIGDENTGPRTGMNDLVGPAAQSSVAGGVNDAVYNGASGCLEFSGTGDREAAWSQQSSHQHSRSDRKFYPHLHIIFITANAVQKNSRWKLEVNYAPLLAESAAAYGAFLASYTNTITVPTPLAITAGKCYHYIQDFDTLTIPELTSSSYIVWKVTRLANSDAADTDTAMIALHSCDLHYESDILGYTPY